MSATSTSRNGSFHNSTTLPAGIGLEISKSVPGLKKNARLGTGDERTWAKWQKHLAARKAPAAIAKLWRKGSASPLFWSLTEDCSAVELKEFADELSALSAGETDANREHSSRVAHWLQQRSAAGSSATVGLEAIAWAHALSELCAVWDETAWCAALQNLIQLTTEAVALSGETQPLEHQLLAGELPLTLASLFPEIEACHRLAKPARQVISHGVAQLLDGEGLIHARHLPLARPLLATWVRTAAAGESRKKGSFDEPAFLQLGWFIRHLLRLMRQDGTQSLTSGEASAFNAELFAAAIEFFGTHDDARLAELTLPKGEGTPRKYKDFPEPSAHSEWGGLVILRANWSRHSPRLAIAYDHTKLQSEFAVGRHVLWTGDCLPQIRIADQTISPVDAWEEVCWFEDADTDYIELELRYQNGWRLQRQFLLARNDEILFVADALLGESSQPIDYRMTWPLLSQVTVLPAKETTECQLACGSPAAVVLPLALPEWRCDPTARGSLQGSSTGLTYQMSVQRQRLYAPLLFDLQPKRFKKELTWRQLTVGQARDICSPEAAVGFRAQVGSDQWLVYRSLDGRANRTVLGQNTSDEFILTRFLKSGDTDSLVEVE